jgi:hypothetical protein
MATRATEAVRRRLADALTHIDEKDEQKLTDGGVFNAWVNIEGKAEAKLFLGGVHSGQSTFFHAWNRLLRRFSAHGDSSKYRNPPRNQPIWIAPKKGHVRRRNALTVRTHGTRILEI